MDMKKTWFILSVIILPALYQVAQAQYVLRHSILSSGSAAAQNNSHQISGTLGQPVTGVASNNRYIQRTGFWYILSNVGPAVTGIGKKAPPTAFLLKQNYPNPFSFQTTIGFELKETSAVRMDVYNSTGQLVRRLVDRTYPPGRYSVVWNGLDLHGKRSASGVYFYRIETPSAVRTSRMILLR